MLQTFFQYVVLPPLVRHKGVLELGLKILLEAGDIIRSCVL